MLFNEGLIAEVFFSDVLLEVDQAAHPVWLLRLVDHGALGVPQGRIVSGVFVGGRFDPIVVGEPACIGKVTCGFAKQTLRCGQIGPCGGPQDVFADLVLTSAELRCVLCVVHLRFT